MSEIQIAPSMPIDFGTPRHLRLVEVLEQLAHANLTVPVIVEGKNDKSALRLLELKGEIITLNRGGSIYEFGGWIAERYDEVILLMDWDHEGDRLSKKLDAELGGYHEKHDHLRDKLRAICQKDIRAIENIPKLLTRLKQESIDAKAGQ